ncbi:hypothetical protein [Streptomyces sp. KL116D]|uniref:hypothetical protein n=1 Tax=Streptomyces sp. KL116D TaxID=3045152 RepID=UPI003557443A
MAPWEDRIRQSVVRFLEPALDGAPFDLAEQALLLPAIVTGPLLGIPERDWAELVQLTAMVTAPPTRTSSWAAKRDARHISTTNSSPTSPTG